MLRSVWGGGGGRGLGFAEMWGPLGDQKAWKRRPWMRYRLALTKRKAAARRFPSCSVLVCRPLRHLPTEMRCADQAAKVNRAMHATNKQTNTWTSPTIDPSDSPARTHRD